MFSMSKNNIDKQQPKRRLGYVQKRISRAANDEITRQALAEGRTFIAQLDRILRV